MLCCSACESGARSNPKRGRKLTLSLDFAKISSQRNIIAFTVLFYRKFRYDPLGPGQVVWTREMGK